MSNDEKIDANEIIDVECSGCGGEGTYESDEFSYARNGGHYTKSHKCETCGGTGQESITRYASLERDYEAEGRENVRLTRELNAAHARIVELTKQLQKARLGGDVSSAGSPGNLPATTEASAPTPTQSVSNVPAETLGDTYEPITFGA